MNMKDVIGSTESNLFGAHKQEMLYRMSYTWHIIQVIEASDVDVQGRADLVRIFILNEQSFKFIR
jgi:hypothetical protein